MRARACATRLPRRVRGACAWRRRPGPPRPLRPAPRPPRGRRRRTSPRRTAFVTRPGLTISGDGTALASWRWSDATGSEGRVGVDAAVRAPGAAAFGPERRARRRRGRSPRSVVTGPVAYGAHPRAAGHQPRGQPRPRQPAAAARRALRQPTAASGAPGPCARRCGCGTRALAVNAARRRGAGVVGGPRRAHRPRLRRAAAARAGASGAPVRLATGRIRGVAVAIGARGDVLVAWDARGVVRTRLKPARRAPVPRHRHDPLAARLQRRPAPRRGAQRPRASSPGARSSASEGGGTGPVRFEVAVRAGGRGAASAARRRSSSWAPRSRRGGSTRSSTPAAATRRRVVGQRRAQHAAPASRAWTPTGASHAQPDVSAAGRRRPGSRTSPPARAGACSWSGTTGTSKPPTRSSPRTRRAGASRSGRPSRSRPPGGPRRRRRLRPASAANPTVVWTNRPARLGGAHPDLRAGGDQDAVAGRPSARC